MIKITEKAKEKLDAILAENPGKFLRIFAEGVG